MSDIVAEYRYDPWGKVLCEDDLTEIGALNPFRYRSYYYDSDIEMYYLQSRYYDAEVGRFINCDDVNYIGVTESEFSYNPFAYCVNNPISNIDYFGYAVDFVGFITKILKFMQSLLKDNNVALQVKLCENVLEYYCLFALLFGGLS
ncbi:MAG: RHS repeat-associated core domain-containing protein [Clostridia bacterium]|nr:RHS repeat-associated core domain-containing protein [Clostridia bacterium]